MKRLTPAFVTLVMLLIIGGLIAAYFVKGLFAKTEVPAAPTSRLVPVALQDLKPGTEITKAHIGKAPIANEKLTRETVLSEDALIGRVVRDDIKSAQPIQSSQLFAPGERPALEVAQGMRAVSVGVADGTSMVDGLVQPGQHVDVHFTPVVNDDDERFRGGLTMTLFKGVKVLAINRSIRGSDVSRGSNTVTMELTPEQANIMILARDKGEINLVYNSEGVGNGGVSVSSTERATLEEILGLKEKEKEPAPFRTDVYYGSSRDSFFFRNGDFADEQLDNNNRNYDRGSQRNWFNGGNNGGGYGQRSPNATPNPQTVAPESLNGGNSPAANVSRTNGPRA